MRLQGHKLTTTWNRVRGNGAVTTGTCQCKKWKATGSSQVEVRAQYNQHVADSKKTAKERPAAAKM